MPIWNRKSAGRVDFAKTLVTGVSRPLSERESYKIYNFEKHAKSCKRCNDPYNVYRRGGLLCGDGHELAVSVARLLFRLQEDGTVLKKSRSTHQEVRVEIPSKFINVLGLLWAIEESGEGFLRSAISYDRTYPVTSRPPRSKSVPDNRRHSHHSADGYYDRAEVIAEPNSSSHRRSSKYRGSLYHSDRRDQERKDLREGRTRYDFYEEYHPRYSR